MVLSNAGNQPAEIQIVLREFNIGYLNTDKLILFKKNPKYINFDEGFSDQIIFCLKGISTWAIDPWISSL